MKRKTGYYWVLSKDEGSKWEIGYFHKSVWQLCSVEIYFTDDYFAETKIK